ncbi:MAG: hypothetical protein M3Q14_00640 [bacterium]|nr:hypothetical protein [bacterium]
MNEEPALPRPKTKKRLAIILISLFVMIAISVFVFMMERPSSGKIITGSSSSSPVSQENTARRTSSMAASYFQLEYDAGLDTLSNVTIQNPGSLEAYRVTGDQRILSVTVKQGSNLSEESSYRLRQTQSELYRESTAKHGAHSFVIMKKIDGSEIMAIESGQGRYVIIAYTMNDPLGNLQRETDAILSSFSWL